MAPVITAEVETAKIAAGFLEPGHTMTVQWERGMKKWGARIRNDEIGVMYLRGLGDTPEDAVQAAQRIYKGMTSQRMWQIELKDLCRQERNAGRKAFGPKGTIKEHQAAFAATRATNAHRQLGDMLGYSYPI